MPQSVELPVVPSFDELLSSAQRSAVHLEMRDSYSVGGESSGFSRWKRTGERDNDPNSDYWRPWVEQIAATVARGVVIRRARIVSEPVTDYIRYEHGGTVVNLASGELVRWLPRRQASDIALPGNDFWAFDGEIVVFNHFTGDGDWAEPGKELRTERAVVNLCSSAFEAVWERGVPHEKYSV
ncbi:DUF6879 family protein [Streptacidiphilus sp. N1-12]|uniref:DUF6879 family protein n=2 Tax=Streptacidiphilus alkalitolerans TaxID=3342712 RepID=A0ABV6VG05_9ACTN